MFISPDTTVKVGEVDKFVISNVERVTINDVETNLVKITARRVSDGTLVSKDININAWANPQRVYKDSDLFPGQDNSIEEKQALKAYERSVERFNDAYGKLMDGEVELTPDVLKRLVELESEIPHVMIGRDELKNYTKAFCEVLGVDMSTLMVDERMLNAKADFKKDRLSGEIVRSKGTASRSYEGTKFMDCASPVLDFEYAGYKDIINFYKKNLVNKPFNMVVGGEYSYKDGSGPHPTLPPARSGFVQAVKEGEPSTLTFSPIKHVSKPYVKKSNIAKNVTREGEADDLPF